MKLSNEEWDGFVDEWLEAQPASRINVILERALKEANLEELPEADSYDFEEKFEPAFNRIAVKMAFEDFYREMADQGLISPTVDPDGEIGYEVTELGMRALEEEELVS
jgi:hypothetical protein